VSRCRLQQRIQWTNVEMRSKCSFVGAVLCITAGHTCGRPATEAGEVNLATTTPKPVINKTVPQHVWVEVDSHLESAFFDDATYPASGEGSNAANPESVRVGLAHSYPAAEGFRRLFTELDGAPLAALSKDAEGVVLGDVFEFQVRDFGES